MKIKEYYPVDIVAGLVSEHSFNSFLDGDAHHLLRARRAAGYNDDDAEFDDLDEDLDDAPPQTRANLFEGCLTTLRKNKVTGEGKSRSYTFTDAINFQDGLQFHVFSNNRKVADGLKECANENGSAVLHIIQRAGGFFEVLMVERYRFYMRDEMLMIDKESIGRRLLEIR